MLDAVQGSARISQSAQSGAPTQEAPATKDFDVVGSTCHHRLEEPGVRFCGTSGKFPHMPRGGEEPGPMR